MRTPGTPGDICRLGRGAGGPGAAHVVVPDCLKGELTIQTWLSRAKSFRIWTCAAEKA